MELTELLKKFGFIDFIKAIYVHDLITSLSNDYTSGKITRKEIEELKQKIKEIYEEICKI